jgi:hypothetical protein
MDARNGDETAELPAAESGAPTAAAEPPAPNGFTQPYDPVSPADATSADTRPAGSDVTDTDPWAAGSVASGFSGSGATDGMTADTVDAHSGDAPAEAEPVETGDDPVSADVEVATVKDVPGFTETTDADAEPADAEPAKAAPAEETLAEEGEDDAEDGDATPTAKRARRSWPWAASLGRHARAAAARATASGLTFSRLTLLPAMLVMAWLLPAIPLLLAGSFELAPMLLISIPLALFLIVVCLRRVPGHWPMSAQAKPGPGSPAPLWSLLATVAVAAGFIAWQFVMRSQQLIVTRDPGVYLQFGYWIAQHGSVSIPVSASSFGGAHAGLGFSSIGFVQHHSHLAPQFLAGLPSLLAAGFWAGGTGGAVIVPCVLGGFAILTFAGLVGRLAGPRWAPAGALVLALALPQQYTSRSAFAEPLIQILLFGALCLLIDSLCIPPLPQTRPSTLRRRWGLPDPPSPLVVLGVLGGLALGLTSVASVEGLSIALPAVPVLGVMFVGRRKQWIPISLGLLVGVAFGLATGYVLARSYLDSLSSWMGPFGIIAGALVVVTLDAALVWRYARLGGLSKRLLAYWPLRWLPEAVAALTVLVVVGFAIRPYVQTVRGGLNSSTVAYVGFLQRVAGLPLDPRRTYAEDTLYWVIWYIGLPALLLGVFGLALLARRVVRALITWHDPTGTARLWALPLLIIGWACVTVLWRPGTVPDQPWASRRLVPVVLPGLILAAVWVAAWLNGRASVRGAGKGLSSAVAVLCVGALLLPTTLTTFGIGVATTGQPSHVRQRSGLALQQTGLGETKAIDRLCAAIGPGASVVIVNPRIANEFTQVIRGMCDVPVAWMDRPSLAALQPVLTGITSAHRRPVLLGASPAELGVYGEPARQVLDLTTTEDAHVLTHPATSTWLVRYTIWMSQPG